MILTKSREAATIRQQLVLAAMTKAAAPVQMKWLREKLMSKMTEKELRSAMVTLRATGITEPTGKGSKSFWKLK